MRLLTLPGVFKPPSDSWLLVEAVRREAPFATALDLCTGSGVIAAAAARCGATATATDVSRRAVWTARLNGALHGRRVRARRGDLYEPVADERFELVTANPPYVPGDTPPAHGAARAWEGGEDGRAVLDRVIDGAPAHLTDGGRLLVVHSEVSDIEASLARMRDRGLDAEVVAEHRGPPGPLVSERFPRIATELIVVIRATARVAVTARARAQSSV